MLYENLGSEEVREGILLLLRKALRSQILASTVMRPGCAWRTDTAQTHVWMEKAAISGRQQ